MDFQSAVRSYAANYNTSFDEALNHFLRTDPPSHNSRSCIGKKPDHFYSDPPTVDSSFSQYPSIKTPLTLSYAHAARTHSSKTLLSSPSALASQPSASNNRY